MEAKLMALVSKSEVVWLTRRLALHSPVGRSLTHAAEMDESVRSARRYTPNWALSTGCGQFWLCAHFGLGASAT
jgi:hypothetical protein